MKFDFLKIRRIKNQLKAQVKEAKGFSLLEILLVVGVISVLGLGIVELTQGWANQEKNLSTARHLRIIHNAAESYIRDNFSTILLFSQQNKITIKSWVK